MCGVGEQMRKKQQRLLKNMDAHKVMLDLLQIPYDKVASGSPGQLHPEPQFNPNHTLAPDANLTQPHPDSHCDPGFCFPLWLDNLNFIVTFDRPPLTLIHVTP